MNFIEGCQADVAGGCLSLLSIMLLQWLICIFVIGNHAVFKYLGNVYKFHVCV